MAYTSRIMAWVYPTDIDINATTEYSDGRLLWALKPEYLEVNTSGAIIERPATNPDYAYNGYSTANALLIKQKSSHQYVTVSCNNWTTKGDVLCSNGTNRSNAITVILDMLNAIGFDGVELDFEPFGNFTMTAQQWTNYKTFVTELGNALHTNGYKLMVDGPAVNNTDSQSIYTLYRFRYAEMNDLPVDYLCVMAYDDQWNHTVSSTNSVAPIAWLENCCDFIKTQVDINKLIIGLPSYGYHHADAVEPTDIIIDTKAQSTAYTGYGTATRNADGEMNWLNSGTRYFYQDSTGLDQKRDAVEAKGIKYISVWHLGGNDWFPDTEPPARALATRTLATSRTAATSRTLATNREIA